MSVAVETLLRQRTPFELLPLNYSLLTMNPTQLLGILTFLTAAIVGWLASRQGQQPVWRLSCLTYIALSVELWIGLRHRLGEQFSSLAKRLDLYEMRQSYQPLLIGMILFAVLAALIWISRRRKTGNTPSRWASFSLISLLGLFLVESISLHAVDGLLYRQRLGSIMLIGYLWVLASLPHLLAGIYQARQPSRTTRNVPPPP